MIPIPQALQQIGHTPKLSAALAMLSECKGLKIRGAYLLTIGRESYAAVRYSQTMIETGGQVSHSGKPLDWTREAFYVLSDKLPASYRRNPGGCYTEGLRFAFTSPGELCEGLWYVAAYSSDESVKLGGLRHFLLFKETQPNPAEGRIQFGKAISL